MSELQDKTRLPSEVKTSEITEEQLKAISRRSQKLIEQDKLIQTACATLMISQQLYHCGLQALNRQIDKIGEKPDIEAALVQSMRHGAMQPFKRPDLLKKLQDHILPWLLGEMAGEEEREGKHVAAEIIKENEQRAKIDIPIGFLPDKDWKEMLLPRDRTLVLAGHRGAVKFMLDMIVRAIIEIGTGFRPNILRMVDNVLAHSNITKSEWRDKQYIECGVNRWIKCASSDKALTKTLAPWIKAMRKLRTDLLVIDDMGLLLGESTLAVQTRAGQAHKRIRKWADTLSAAVIGGIPMSPEELKLDRSWSQLEVYTHLRFLTVHENSDDTYQINCGLPDQPDTETILVNSIGKQFIDFKSKEK